MLSFSLRSKLVIVPRWGSAQTQSARYKAQGEPKAGAEVENGKQAQLLAEVAQKRILAVDQDQAGERPGVLVGLESCGGAWTELHGTPLLAAGVGLGQDLLLRRSLGIDTRDYSLNCK